MAASFFFINNLNVSTQKELRFFSLSLEFKIFTRIYLVMYIYTH